MTVFLSGISRKRFSAGMTVLAFLLFSVSSQLYAAGSNDHIIKWVDEKGVTHYGDSVPPQYADRAKTQLNSRGLTVKQTQNDKSKAEKTSKQLTEQERSDNALLASYTSEQEIDDARGRNLQSANLLTESLKQRKISAQARMDARKKTMDDIIKRKKPIPDDLIQEQKDNQAEMARIDDQIKQQNSSIEGINKRFDSDKKRYIALKSAAEAKPQ